jgi:hypothetical protein
MCIRVGSSLSPVFNYYCEMRQGCPASLILFDLFINDLLQDMKGVTVPGVDNTINGLMFADDAVILAGSKGKMQRSLDLLSVWSEKHEIV